MIFHFIDMFGPQFSPPSYMSIFGLGLQIILLLYVIISDSQGFFGVKIVF